MTVNEAFALIKSDVIANNKDVSRWADLGCGDGIFTSALSNMLSKESIIYGIDKNKLPDPRIASNGVAVITKRLDFVNDNLGLENLTGILMANSFHYVKHKPEFIEKVQTHLTQDAILLMVEYDTDIAVTKWVPYPISFSSLAALFKSAGYNNIKKLNERPSIYGRANMYSALIMK